VTTVDAKARAAESTPATGDIWLRYEDVAQDGRVRLEAMTASLGVVWRRRLGHHPLYPACRDAGILPILTRFVIEGEAGPFAVEGKVTVEGDFEIAKTLDDAGAVDRLLLEIHTTLTAPLGRTNLPPPAEAGTVARVGRVLAEHVFTRPFGPPEQRKVLEFGPLGKTDMLPIRPWAEPRALLELPADARPLENSLTADTSGVVFGTSHTDSNQHVNSLVYPRLFEEALLRRLIRHGRTTDRLARSVDVRYRKPSFHGETAAIVLRAYEREGRVGAVGAFVDPGGDVARARAYLRLEME
jgi:hypothetical protein